MYLIDTREYLIKVPVPEMGIGYNFWSCWPMRSQRQPPNTFKHYRLLPLLWSFSRIWWKHNISERYHITWVMKHDEIKSVQTQKLHSYWITIIVLEGDMKTPEGEKETSITPTCKPGKLNVCLSWQTVPTGTALAWTSWE